MSPLNLQHHRQPPPPPPPPPPSPPPPLQLPSTFSSCPCFHPLVHPWATFFLPSPSPPPPAWTEVGATLARATAGFFFHPSTFIST
ncbi:hypothetical protein ALC53_11109 [Atta colombica]|uniref:Uncharacterized protein n=1 Tax=Atta colombica TaxID=520822 RepID=A0A195B2M3_9HYME|nr:hypothetical protein ALC53_11109 [Atta colombica]